jgi:hypothetical protein
MHHLGIPKLTGRYLPGWPEGLDWPTQEGRRLLRFRWERGFDDRENWMNILLIIEFIKKKGTTFLPAATNALGNISEDDLKSCVVGKYKSLQKTWRDEQKKAAIVAAPADGDDPIEIVPKADLSKAKRQTRQRGVSFSCQTKDGNSPRSRNWKFGNESGRIWLRPTSDGNTRNTMPPSRTH